MLLDELQLDQQDSALYCYSCGTIRTDDTLGLCLLCGAHICGMDGCESLCACDDALRELGLSRIEPVPEAGA